eukprot:TRINITY_DN10303_c0_g3_i1.p1 TRINITY_DN10303_c0_g3~~TRINITY_DN10303_c0_g3_i1.p1  ORF type:complete len:1039 (+),score=151.88 TRINITY_DN10303_c0_g3_i1:216-3332(+)
MAGSPSLSALAAGALAECLLAAREGDVARGHVDHVPGAPFRERVPVASWRPLGPSDGGAAASGAWVCDVDVCELLDQMPQETMALFTDVEGNLALLEKELVRLAATPRDWSFCWNQATVAPVPLSPRVRLGRVPPCLGVAVRSLAEVRHNSIGRFIATSCVATRVSASRAAPQQATIECGLCGHRFAALAQPCSWCEIEIPRSCPGPRCRGRGSEGQLRTVDGSTEMMDYQEVRVQDSMITGRSAAPCAIKVVLTRDLVGKVAPGDAVVIGGWVRARWPHSLRMGQRADLELVLEANHVRRLADQGVSSAPLFREFGQFWATAHCQDEFRGRAELVRRVAPHLRGLEVPKLALLLALIGAPAQAEALEAPDHIGAANLDDRWEHFVDRGSAVGSGSAASVGGRFGEVGQHIVNDNGAGGGTGYRRSTPHLLLIGDPGCGKSQLLEAARQLSSHVVRTSGVGMTRAGLTCVCQKDGPGYALEAGALVLADGGVCCIDEFGAIPSDERAVLHEAMEQQTVSIARPGLCCRLRCRCTIVAAQNWAAKGVGAAREPRCLDERNPAAATSACHGAVAAASGLPASLLSRFDLIFVLRNISLSSATSATLTGTEDAAVADAILNLKSSSAVAGAGPDDATNVDDLQDYVAWARRNRLPKEPEESARTVVEQYYRLLRRRRSDESSSATSTRALEGILRLTAAHARLLGHDGIQLQDAIAAVLLHQLALRSQESASSSHELLLQPSALGPGAPKHLRSMSLSFDLTCQEDYGIAEAALLSALELRKDAQTGSIVPGNRRSHRHRPAAFGDDFRGDPLRSEEQQCLEWTTPFADRQRGQELERSRGPATMSPMPSEDQRCLGWTTPTPQMYGQDQESLRSPVESAWPPRRISRTHDGRLGSDTSRFTHVSATKNVVPSRACHPGGARADAFGTEFSSQPLQKPKGRRALHSVVNRETDAAPRSMRAFTPALDGRHIDADSGPAGCLPPLWPSQRRPHSRSPSRSWSRSCSSSRSRSRSPLGFPAGRGVQWRHPGGTCGGVGTAWPR